MKKNQSSLEFLLIFGIGFSIVLILGGIFFSYSGEIRNSFNEKQANKVMTELIDNIEQIYFYGVGNKNTLKTTFPDGIENFTIVHNNVTDPNNSSRRLYYDNFELLVVKEGNSVPIVYNVKEPYIRFNCTKCYHTTKINGEWISYYNRSDFNEGIKEIRVENKGEWVSVDFYDGE